MKKKKIIHWPLLHQHQVKPPPQSERPFWYFQTYLCSGVFVLQGTLKCYYSVFLGGTLLSLQHGLQEISKCQEFPGNRSTEPSSFTFAVHMAQIAIFGHSRGHHNWATNAGIFSKAHLENHLLYSTYSSYLGHVWSLGWETAPQRCQRDPPKLLGPPLAEVFVTLRGACAVGVGEAC